MFRYLVSMALAAIAFACANPAQAKTLCTVIADAGSGQVLLQQGDCESRVTPASTFKIPLAVMGFDAGFLADERSPSLPFREGYPDWIEAWKRDTDPSAWMKNSVLWYSQEITRSLGVSRLESYASAFNYGNADFAGDPGKDNALERAWVSSSLKISPVEQIAFLRRLYNRDLPVSDHAITMTHRIVETSLVGGGWSVHGKTGSAYPRQADGSFDRARGWGWFVGWATKGERTVVFARLDQDETRTQGPRGIRARNAFLKEFPSLVD
ncbi:class D beta-lactamase [Mesorhizobium sp. CAU 1732]|uniref:class D beta-lactamase n=1 Tax=Mesorhizobium sp. CAU 1732 TaxID=3140358 RepID=UPI0032617A83